MHIIRRYRFSTVKERFLGRSADYRPSCDTLQEVALLAFSLQLAVMKVIVTPWILGSITISYFLAMLMRNHGIRNRAQKRTLTCYLYVLFCCVWAKLSLES